MPRGRFRSWTDDDLRAAVAKHTNRSDVIRELGLRPAGGNHRSVQFHIERLGLDVSHFSDEKKIRATLATRLLPRAYDEVFRERCRVSPAVVRRHALREIRPYVCRDCGNPGTHNGKPLTLHLDHINGVHDDNRLENLRWLCPNCHSQTPTYCGRSSRRRPNRVSERARPWRVRTPGR
jgi:5-methylcytosine-specific restriction endonuclease McrA